MAPRAIASAVTGVFLINSPPQIYAARLAPHPAMKPDGVALVQTGGIGSMLGGMLGGGQPSQGPTDTRGTVGNLAAGLLNMAAPNSCIGDVILTGYKDDTYNEDDYPLVSNCMGKGADNQIMCFPGQSQVHVEGGSRAPMAQLQIGDRVLAWDSKQQMPSYQRVAFFLHRDFTRESSDWVKISHNAGQLVMSSTHMVLRETSQKGVFDSVAAKRVRPGDSLRLADQSTGMVLAVEAAGRLPSSGIFAPVTESGTLYVDGVLVSSYSSLDLFGAAEGKAHNILNWLVAPLKVVSRLGATTALPSWAASLGFGLSGAVDRVVLTTIMLSETLFLHGAEAARAARLMFGLGPAPS